MKKTLLGATAVTAALALVAVAPAASAAELPDTDDLYAYHHETGLYGVDSDGVAVFVGGVGGLDTWGADYNPVDGLAYLFDDADQCSLYSADLATGVETLVGEIDDVFGDNGCDGIDIDSDGTILVAGEEGLIAEISSLDASIIDSNQLTGEDFDGDLAFIATNPVSGILYAGNYSGVLFTIDTTTWVATEVQDIDDYWESADFDSTGVLWFQGSGDDCSNGLWSLAVGESPVFQGDFTVGEDCLDPFAVFTTPAEVEVAPAPPTLAATGSDATPAVLLGSAAIVLVLVGALVVVARPRRVA